MESNLTSPELLEQLHCPAFLVKDGYIQQANQAATQRQFSVGSAISEYIALGAEEYEAFAEGKLCLTLAACDTCYNACVIKCEDVHIFYLDSDYQEPELRAFALAAQQLREPLANAMTCANYLLPDKCSEDVQLQLAQLNKNLHQLHRSICNMSDVATYQSIRYSQCHCQEIGSVFEEIMEKAAQYIAKGDHTLTYTNLNKQLYTKVDAEKLERALLNLISNAVKFAPSGSNIHASVRLSEKKVYFSIENINAVPVTNQIGNIFNNYLREPGIEHPQAGIGLGLAIVRKTAAAHKGTLLLESLENSGLRFTMTIAVEDIKADILRSPVRLTVDYAGGYDHTLTELSDILSPELYK